MDEGTVAFLVTVGVFVVLLLLAEYLSDGVRRRRGKPRIEQSEWRTYEVNSRRSWRHPRG